MAEDHERDEPQVAGAWSEYRRLVIKQLEALEDGQNSMRDALSRATNDMRDAISKHDKATDEDVGKLRERIAIVETKAAALGFAAGLAVSIAAALLKKFI